MSLVGVQKRVLHSSVPMEIIIQDNVLIIDGAEIDYGERPIIVWAMERAPETVF